MINGIIIQARMGSTRLPGKVMLPIIDKPVLEHIIERLQDVDNIDTILVATSDHEKDDIIADFSANKGIHCYRGSENDVLARFYNAAEKYNLDNIVRITSDCPLIDPMVVRNIVDTHLKNNYDMTTNGGPIDSNRTFPRGFDVSVFSMDVLKEAYYNAESKREREHVTPYMYANKQVKYYMLENADYSHYRLTLDTPEDYQLIKIVYENLHNDTEVFMLNDIIEFMENNKELVKINAKIEQKKE